VAVVLGAEIERIRRELTPALATAENPRWAEGRASSLQAGIAAFPEADGYLFLPVDAVGIQTATVQATLAAAEVEGPVYLRIAGSKTPRIYRDDYRFEFGRGVTLRQGTDLAIIATGNIVHEVQLAVDVLDAAGVSVRLINIHTIKPIDREAILKAVMETRRIVTIEEHNVMSGLGTAVAEVIVESGKACAFTKLGIPDAYAIVGYPEDLYNHYKIDADGIVEAVSALMGREIEEDENWDDET